MMTARTFTTAEADRLLGLADQFLQDWARDRPSPWRSRETNAKNAPPNGTRSARCWRWPLAFSAKRNRWGGDFASDTP